MRVPSRPLTVAVAAGLGAAALSLTTASAGWTDQGNDNSQGGLTVTTILSGKTLTHTFTPATGGAPQTESLTKPDDITRLGNDIYVGFQNGVGPQGQPSGDLNTDSTVVELTTSGTPLAQWDVMGKVDGLTADPGLNAVIAT